jgi:hypothetical protein
VEERYEDNINRKKKKRRILRKKKEKFGECSEEKREKEIR